jgi:hypothetical protein
MLASLFKPSQTALVGPSLRGRLSVTTHFQNDIGIFAIEYRPCNHSPANQTLISTRYGSRDVVIALNVSLCQQLLKILSL